LNESLQYFNTAVLSGIAGTSGTETGRAVVMRFVDLKKRKSQRQKIRYTLECTFHVCQTAVTVQRSTRANDVYLTGKQVSRLYETLNSPLCPIRKKLNPVHIFTHPNCAQQSPSCEVHTSQASQEIIRTL